MFNLAQNCYINFSILDKFSSKLQIPFNNKKFKNTIIKCNNLSTLRLDCISWKYLKAAVKNEKYLINIVNITNVYINTSHQLSHFKKSLSIIIPKSNKIT